MAVADESRGTEHNHSCHNKPASWRRSPLFWTSLGTALLLGLSYVLPALAKFHQIFFDYMGAIWWAILLGFVLGGLIDRYIPSNYITRYLATSQKRSIGYALGLGFLMSACSHGMLAIAMELHRKGASGPAVVAFLLASPWANLPITVLFFGFFGIKALLILGSALLIALITGWIFLHLEARGLIERNPNAHPAPADFSIRADLGRRFRERRWTLPSVVADLGAIGRGAWSLAQMVLWWILIGISLAGLAGTFVPEHFFHQYMGPSLVGLFITLGVATIIEICSEGSAPLAFEIYRQTGAFGNSFVFLMAGVVTDYTEIGLLWKNLGRRTAIWLVIVSVPQTLLLGWLMNRL